MGTEEEAEEEEDSQGAQFVSLGLKVELYSSRDVVAVEKRRATGGQARLRRIAECFARRVCERDMGEEGRSGHTSSMIR